MKESFPLVQNQNKDLLDDNEVLNCCEISPIHGDILGPEPITESEPVNYITTVFGENVVYDTGFSSEFRKDISNIKINDSEKLEIEKL